MDNFDLRIQQISKLNFMISSLSRKAGLPRVPGLVVSKSERFVNVNVFDYRIGVGENLLSLWAQGLFSEDEVQSAVAHEIGHLMDFKRGSGSSSFRNLILESGWVVCGVVPLLVCILFPSVLVFRFSVGFILGWGISIPLVVRRFGAQIEFEADRNAALYLVEPAHLASVLGKIKTLTVQGKCFELCGNPAGFVGKLTHPSLDKRICRLSGLSKFGVPLMRLWQSRVFE
jgi:Zn-dependent protease with chaperone function